MRKAHNNRQKTIICKRCGMFFMSSPSKNPIFCSRNCRWPTMVVVCKQCEKPVFINLWKKTHRKNLFCSVQCRNTWSERCVLVNCFFCGKEFKKKASQVSRSLRHFCSQDCSRKFHVAENHYAFCGGKGYGPEWRTISIKIRARDKICLMCWKTKEQNGRELDVHHKIPFERFGYVNRMKAHDPENLITFCRSCHRWITKFYVQSATIPA